MAVQAVCYLSALKAHVRIGIVSLFSFTGLSERMMHKLTWVTFFLQYDSLRRFKIAWINGNVEPAFFIIIIETSPCLFAFVQQRNFPAIQYISTGFALAAR